MKGKIKVADAVLFAIIFVAVAAFLIVFFIRKNPGKEVRVTVNGEVTATFSLSEDRTYTVETDEGTNILVIKDGAAYVSDADCKDRICVKTGKIDEVGESIICLPHRVVIEIVE